MVSATLQCWWDGVHVAEIRAMRPWDLRCRYTAEALDRWAIGTPLLSCSLPVASRPRPATNFFRGLLPEGRQLQAVADLAKVTTNDYAGLLARFGRDIAGALVIVAEDDEPQPGRGSVAEYSSVGLEHEVEALGDNPLGLHADSELSIAGIQNKLLLVAIGDGRWGRPVHGQPSTHILKVDDDRFPGLVRAEAECLALAHAIGLAGAAPRLERHAGTDCLIVERYDRRIVDGEVRRTHQEDACQALNIDINAHRGRGKYEAFGGPTLQQVARLLRVHARDSEAELDKLVRLVAYTVVIGNADLHGKNISLLHDGAGHIALAPAYDTVPTMLWPKLRATGAVAINGRTDLSSITVADIGAEAGAWGSDASRAIVVATETVAAALDAVPGSIKGADLATAITGRAVTLLS